MSKKSLLFSALALHCCNALAKNQQENRKFAPPPSETIILKLCTRDYVREVTPHVNFSYNRFSGAPYLLNPHPKCVKYRVPTVRESPGILRESGKVREKSGNFEILLARPIIYVLFSQFLSALPPDSHRGSAPVNTASQFILQYFTMEQSLVLHLCTQYCFTGVANKEISQGKLFILSEKVRENEFCKVVGTLEIKPVCDFLDCPVLTLFLLPRSKTWTKSVVVDITRNTFCGTWYLPHSHVHNERTVLL